MPSLRNLAVVVVTAALALAACGGDDDAATDTSSSTTDTASPTGPAADAITVTASGFQFVERAPVVTAGGEITFTHDDGTTHTFTARDGAFNSDDVGQGETATVTAPADAGTYDFYCVYHPAMTGTLTVE